MLHPFRESVSERGLMRLKLKFIIFYAHLQWKTWGCSWPGAIRFLKIKKIKEKLPGFTRDSPIIPSYS